MSEFLNFRNVPIVSLDELVKAGDIELGRGNIISKIDIRENKGPFPIYSSSSKNNGMMGRYGNYMFDEEMVTWSVDGGGTFFYRPKHKFSVTNVSGYMRANQQKFDYKFLNGVLNHQHSFFNFDYQSKAHPSVIREMYEIPIPPILEQKKIALILTSVDDLIQNSQDQIDKLEDLKKATMNELLTRGIGHKEFKDSELGRIPKDWEVSVVRNSILNMSSGWSPDCLSDPAVGSQWGILKTTSVTWNGFDINENKALPPHLEGRMQISLRAGDVLITRAGPVDRVGVVAFCNKTFPKIMLSDKIIRIQSKSDELQGEFLSIWLGSYTAQQNIKSKISGMAKAQSNISQDILKSIPLPLPSLLEQKQIIQILRSLKNRIRVQKTKLAQIQSIKKSLMQDLLTGKVRVKVN